MVAMVYGLKKMLIPLLLPMISLTISLLGLILLATGYGLNHSTIASLSFGLTGLVTSMIVWTIRPKSLMTWPKCLKRFFGRQRRLYKCSDAEVLDRDKAEMIMKNIRGIPYLIQAIQYSMETTYYSAMMAEKSGDIPTTSVIHTAPKCISVIDSDHEDCCFGPETVIPKEQSAVRVVETIEEWIPTGLSSWNNTQLRLSIKSNPETGINVFPYSEVMPHLSADPILELVETPGEISLENEEKSIFLRRSDLKKNFQLRCMAMSSDFLHRFCEAFRSFPH
uniref:Pecanex-like protein n=1 Tax=Elaeophora elaphi TaxID=1147741 RepID=A0A0R3RYW6_9BILA